MNKKPTPSLMLGIFTRSHTNSLWPARSGPDSEIFTYAAIKIETE